MTRAGYDERTVEVPGVALLSENRTSDGGLSGAVLAEFGLAAVLAGAQDDAAIVGEHPGEYVTDVIANLLHYLARHAADTAPVDLDGERDVDIPHLIDSVLERARLDFHRETFPAARVNPRAAA
jgi:hypothetical protein